MNVSKDRPLVSIIVASHRSEWMTQLCDNLLKQEFYENDYEIIIVTDYQCGEIGKMYTGIQWVYIPDFSISIKRNAGINRAKGEYIAFTDDDCIPSRNWLKTGYEYLQGHKHCCGVEGFTSIENANVSGRMRKEYGRLERQGFRTNNIFYRRSDIIETGLFDTRFSVQREDVDIAFTLLSKGYVIDYCNDIRVVHRFRSQECWDLLKNCWNRRFDPLLFKKHPGLYRKYIKTPFPRTIVLLSGLLFALPFTFLFGLHNAAKYTGFMVGIISVLGIQRTGRTRLTIKNTLSEILSLLLAPLILIAALMYGSVKFRKMLIL